MILVKQNETSKIIPFLLVDSTDHITGLTGVVPVVTISKNGGTFAAVTGVVAEVGDGWYKITPHASDVDTLGPLLIHATGTGADPSDVHCRVVAFDPDTATNLGLSNLDAAVSSRSSISVSDIWDGQTVSVDGAATTLKNVLRLIARHLDGDVSIVNTTLTVADADGIVATYTLDDASNPTSKTKA